MIEQPDVDTVRNITAMLASCPVPDEDAERVSEIRALEELKAAAEARQAALAAGLTESKATASEVGLARRESHHRGRRHVALARIAPTELPHTWQAWRHGRVSEWRVTLVARETSCLTLEHRQQIDAELAGDPARIEGLGDRELIGYCRERAAALDVASVVARRRRAESERCVTIRPAPDSMVYLTALLPVASGVAAYAALGRAADTSRSEGDPRGRGQVMADTFAAMLLSCVAQEPPTPAVALDVVLTDRALFGGADDPAHLDGYGPIDAELARELAHGDRVWLRRALADPHSGELVALEARARRFPAGLRRLVRLRDRTCRTPWCDAPVRHIDHVQSVRTAGDTSSENAAALCEACNQAKETTGWSARPRPGPAHQIDLTTPGGQRYRSRAPALANFSPGRSHDRSA